MTRTMFGSQCKGIYNNHYFSKICKRSYKNWFNSFNVRNCLLLKLIQLKNKIKNHILDMLWKMFDILCRDFKNVTWRNIIIVLINGCSSCFLISIRTWKILIKLLITIFEYFNFPLVSDHIKKRNNLIRFNLSFLWVF